MIYKKADILVSSILSVIISAIVLIFLIYTFTGFFENPQNKYNQAGLICSASFKNIPSNYQNETSLREYFKISSEVCISKTIETNFVVREIAGLLDSCWTRTGNGEDFLPNLVSDLSVCVYCGSVVAKNDGVFGNDLINLLKKEDYSHLFDSSSFESSNVEYLLNENNLLSNYKSDDELGVFFYLARANISSGCNLNNDVGDCLVTFDRFLRNNNNLYNNLKNYFSNKVPAIGGLLLTKIEKNSDLELGGEIKIASGRDLGDFSCDIFVFPKEHLFIK